MTALVHAVAHISEDGDLTCACGRLFAQWMFTDARVALIRHIDALNAAAVLNKK